MASRAAVTAVATEEKRALDELESVSRVNSSGIRLRLEKQRVWWRLSIEDPCACLGLGGEGTGGSSGSRSKGDGDADGFDRRFGGVTMMNEYDQIDGDLGSTLSLDAQLRTFRALERAAR